MLNKNFGYWCIKIIFTDQNIFHLLASSISLKMCIKSHGTWWILSDLIHRQRIHAHASHNFLLFSLSTHFPFVQLNVLAQQIANSDFIHNFFQFSFRFHRGKTSKNLFPEKIIFKKFTRVKQKRKKKRKVRKQTKVPFNCIRQLLKWKLNDKKLLIKNLLNPSIALI